MNLKCISCHSVYEAKDFFKCPKCNGILDVKYNYAAYKITGNDSDEFKQNFIFHNQTSSINGEGDTPIVSLNYNQNLFAKYEFSNPTGSFKDRPVAAGIKKALEFGYKKVVVASSGNGAASVAALSAKFKLDCIILIPETTPIEKVRQAFFYGAKVIKVKGPYSNSFKLASFISEQHDFYNLTTTFINPYTVEGDKGVAYEIHFQLKKWPDYIVVPIGAGPLLVGIYKGFMELKKLLQLDTPLPKMVGVQASGCSPIAKAFRKGLNIVSAEENPQTIAGGIGDGLQGYAGDGTYTLNIIKQSGGYCLDVTDKEILNSQHHLAKKNGIFVEPSAASALAGWEKLNKDSKVNNEKTLLILTGHGLKDTKAISIQNEHIPVISPNINDLLNFI